MVLSGLYDYLTSNGVTNVMMGRMPPSPGQVVALRHAGGTSPLDTFDRVWERPMVQVLVRDDAYVNARMCAERVYQLLSQISNVSLSGVWYMSSEVTPPALINRDDDDRPVFAMTASFVKEF